MDVEAEEKAEENKEYLTFQEIHSVINQKLTALYY